MRGTCCLPSVAVRSEITVVPLIDTRQNILEMVQRIPRLSTRRIASRIGVSRMHVSNCTRGNVYLYHDHRVQHLEPGDPVRLMEFCHWITAHQQLLSVILFTDEASFIRDGINNSRNLNTWSHDNHMRQVYLSSKGDFQ